MNHVSIHIAGPGSIEAAVQVKRFLADVVRYPSFQDPVRHFGTVLRTLGVMQLPKGSKKAMSGQSPKSATLFCCVPLQGRMMSSMTLFVNSCIGVTHLC